MYVGVGGACTHVYPGGYKINDMHKQDPPINIKINDIKFKAKLVCLQFQVVAIKIFDS